MKQLTPEELEKRKAMNQKILKFGCLPIVVFFILIIIISSLSDDKKESSESDKKAIVDSLNFPSILLDVDQFSKRYNKFQEQADQPFRIREITIANGSYNNTFTYMLNDHIALMGQINKNDNSIRSISMLGRGDGTTMSGANIVMTMTSIIAITNPEMKPTGRGEVLKDLGILEKNVDINNLSGHTVRNGIKYYISSNDVIGIMFGAQSADDK